MSKYNWGADNPYKAASASSGQYNWGGDNPFNAVVPKPSGAVAPKIEQPAQNTNLIGLEIPTPLSTNPSPNVSVGKNTIIDEYAKLGYKLDPSLIKGYDEYGVPLGASGKRLLYSPKGIGSSPHTGAAMKYVPFAKEPENKSYNESWAIHEGNKNAFGATFVESVVPGGQAVQGALAKSLGLKESPAQIAYEEKPGAAIAGNVAGNLVKYYTGYKLFGPLVEGSGIVKSLSHAGKHATKMLPFLSNMIVEGAKDLAIGTPIAALDTLASGKKGKEFAIEMGKNMVADVLANMFFFGLGKAFDAIKGIKNAKVQESVAVIEDAVKNLPQDEAKAIVQTESAKIATELDNAGIKVVDDGTGQLKFEDNSAKAIDNQSSGLMPKQTAETLETLGLKPQVDATAKALTEQSVQGKFGASKLQQTYKNALKSKTNVSNEFKNTLETFTTIYRKTDNKTQQQIAKQFVSNNFEQAVNYLKSSETIQSVADGAIAKEVSELYSNTGREDEAYDIIMSTYRKYSIAGQYVQSARIFSEMTPQGFIRAVEKKIEKLNAKLPNKKRLKLTEEQSKFLMNSFKKISSSDEKGLIDMFQEIASMRKRKLTNGNIEYLKSLKKDQLINANMQNIANYILDTVPRTLGQKISTIQAFRHLISPKTALRNVLNNSVFKNLELASDYPASIFDWLLSLRTGRRTVKMPDLKLGTIKRNYIAGAEAGSKSLFEINAGISLAGGLGKYDLFKQETFTRANNKVLNTIEKIMNVELRTTDDIMKATIEVSEIAKQLELKGINVDGMTLEQLYKSADAGILETAKQQARYSTFQDESWAAQRLIDLNNFLKKFKIVGSDFTAADLVIKYARVNGNIISRNIEYSPAGSLKLLKYLGTKLADLSAAQQRDIAKTLGRATIGTTILGGIGWLLGKAGILVSGESENNRQEKYEKNTGLSEVRLNIDALGRLLSGNSVDICNGDTLVSLNLIETINVPLTIGYHIGQGIEDNLPANVILKNMGSDMAQEVLSLPTMYVINDIVYNGIMGEDDALDKLASLITIPLKDALPGFIPAMLRQYSQYTDPYKREQNTFGEKLLYNTPFRQKLLPQLDTFGQPVKNTTGLLPMLNPGNVTKYNAYDFGDKLKYLADNYGDYEIYPSGISIKSFSIGGNKYTLNDAQQNEIMQIYGDLLLSEYKRILSLNLGDEKTIDRLKSAQSQMRAEAEKIYAKKHKP